MVDPLVDSGCRTGSYLLYGTSRFKKTKEDERIPSPQNGEFRYHFKVQVADPTAKLMTSFARIKV